MKRVHLLIIIVIAVAIGAIISTAENTSKYVTFDEAFEMAQSGQSDKVHVIGELTRDSENHIIGIEYEPSKEPNYLAFTLVDESGKTNKVICYNPPTSMQDFKKSEKVVIIGAAKGENFIASQILMKCPSKYGEVEVKI